MDKALADSLQAAEELMNASRDQCMLIDTEGRILTVNRTGARSLGKRPEALVDTLCWDHFSGGAAQIWKERHKALVQTGRPDTYVDISDDRIFETYCRPVPEVPGGVLYVAHFTRDITDQVRSEQAIIESEERHRRLFDENPVPMYVYDTNTLEIMDANTSMIGNYGYTLEELTSMTINDIRPSEDVSRVMENVADLKSRQVHLGLWKHTKKDGSVIDVEVTSGDFPYRGRPARLVLCHDVTEKVRIQSALEEREKEYRLLFENNPLPMMIIDPATLKVLTVNHAAVDHYGYSKDEFTRMTIRDFRPAEDIEKAERTIQSLKSPVERLGVHRHLKKNGTVILVDITSNTISYKGQKARLALCNDVTSQIFARTALEESEEKFRSVVESSPMGVHMYRLDDSDRLIFSGANAAADKILGIDHSRLEGLAIDEAFPGSENTEIASRYREVCLSGQPWQNEQFDYEDHRISGSFEVYAFQTGFRSMAVLFLDTTEKRKAREALEESEEKFRKAFLTSPDSMTLSRLEDGVLLEVNDGFVKSTGYSWEESIGKSSFDLQLWPAEGQRDELVGKLTKEGRIENHSISVRCKDGTIRRALISATIVRVGNIPRLFTISRDITELKETEEALMRSEEHLRASLGEKELLLREIHHRVKNNLQVISGLLDLQAHHISDPAGREVYKESRNRVITMALIHEALYQSVNLSQVDFAEYIRNLCENLMISYGVDRSLIELNIEAEKAEVVVDTAVPSGLIVNELITNALKHAFPGGRGGTISLKFRQMKNRSYLLTVSDDGVGLPEDVDIYRTATVGMQLVTVLVRQMGGTLKVKRGGGTTFTIQFREYHEAGSILY